MNWIQAKTRLVRNFPPSARYLVGVSGGRDSVALLHWLTTVGYDDLIVCHLNHQLRGRSSDADARFVQDLVERYNQKSAGPTFPMSPTKTKKKVHHKTAEAHLRIEIGSSSVRGLAKKRRISIEMAAREARYTFFAQIARRHRCHTIFLGHNADDLVETFLINLFRGAGNTGLAAIREISTRPIDNVELTIVRPFLQVWRGEINDYVREHALRFREDGTNKKLEPLRNRVRHQIIPYLEKNLSRNMRATIWRTAAIAAEEEQWMENHTFPLQPNNCGYLPVEKLRELPVALQRRAVLNWLRAQNIADVGFDLIERVRSLLDHDSHIAKVNLPRDRHARRRAGKIFLE
ncbi:MAG TPA: tRNA lysidine(34) synthetase TilS [Candidatus Udaeobacter sp.]|nr:tRNA lysidine(34) synthetase TilS [Candidatus Udaeobacter sp.]